MVGAPVFQFGFVGGAMLYVLLGLVALVVLFYVSLFVISMWERQHLSGDVEPVSEPYPLTPSPYWQATRADALKLGLQPDGVFATKKKTSMVKELQSLFMSPDGLIMAAIASTKVNKKTVLRSRLASGQIMESSDSPGMDDISGLLDRKVLLNAGLAELMNFHVRRIQVSGSTPIPFDRNAALEEFEKIELEKGARMVSLKLARWVDLQQTTIRMTWRGALGNVKNAIQQPRKLKDQADRIAIKRAGSRSGD